MLASASSEGVKLWDVAQGQLNQELPTEGRDIRAIAFAPDGRFLASAGKDDVRLWTVGKDRKVLNPPRFILKGHKGTVNALGFQPGGKLLASAGEDQFVKLWEVATGKELASLRGHEGPVTALAFSANGNLLASGSTLEKHGAGEIKLWEVAPRVERPGFKVRTKWPVFTLAFAPDGKSLATATNTFPNREVRFYETLAGKELAPIQKASPMSALFYLPGSQVLAMVGATGGVPLRDLSTKKEGQAYLDRRGSFVNGVEFSPDCKMLATVGTWVDPSEPTRRPEPELKLWDLTTGKALHALKVRNTIQAWLFRPMVPHSRRRDGWDGAL